MQEKQQIDHQSRQVVFKIYEGEQYILNIGNEFKLQVNRRDRIGILQISRITETNLFYERLSDDTMIIIRKQREKDMNLNKEISFRLEKEGTIKGRQWCQIRQYVLRDKLMFENCLYKIKYQEIPTEIKLINMGSCCQSSQVGRDQYIFPDGGVYTGELKDGLPHGVGAISFENGSSFEGHFENGMKNGKGVYRWGDNSYYDGEFQNDAFNGYGEYYWSNGKWYKGQWIQGNMQGEGQFFSDGKTYKGEFENDKRNGKGEQIWANRQKYIGEWRNGKMHGRGQLIEPNGSVIDGQWVKGRKQ
ncbi:unnamed protein product [Paramecium sonneborni]|uniref:MORN repeat protein n=1 Tax=Paramecium sonneborni TaxID=65129 RepID=A0A8S1QUI5_9CILI|nr:unnamed protein product [Paramecium sonneborni]